MADKNQKRKDILASARALFKEKGFHSTKIEEIAQGAGVGKGTIYEYFKNKQEIFDETCIEYVESIYLSMEELRLMDICFRDKISLMFKEKKSSLYGEFEKNPIDYIMSYKNSMSEKVLISMFNHISYMNKIVIEIINQGKEEGVVKKDIPSELIACLTIGALKEYFNNKLHKKESDFSDEDIIFDLLLNGFGVK